MKHIGHIDGATTQTGWKTHSLGMLSPHDLFIPNPGERENVSADQWTHVGWIDPDKDGGRIWTSHAEAGDNSRPAYVQREAAPTGMIVVDGPVRFEHVDPMNVRRSEFEAHAGALDSINKTIDRHNRAIHDLFQSIKPEPDKVDLTPEQVDKVVAKLTMSKEYGTLPSTIPTGQLLSDALALCNDRLDEHSSSISCENAYADCNAANAMIRELVRRFPADQAYPQYFGEGVKAERPVVHVDPPMTFYDHAFIHAAVNHADYYSAASMTQNVIDDAHAVASTLTRNRANRT